MGSTLRGAAGRGKSLQVFPMKISSTYMPTSVVIVMSIGGRKEARTTGTNILHL